MLQHIHHAEAHDALLRHFKGLWDADAVPVQYENKPSLKNKEQYTKWVAFAIEFGDSSVKGVSDAVEHRNSGRILVDCFAKLGTGQLTFLEIMTPLNDILRSKTVSGVRIGTPLTSPRLSNDTWFNKVVSYPFNFDDK